MSRPPGHYLMWLAAPALRDSGAAAVRGIPGHPGKSANLLNSSVSNVLGSLLGVADVSNRAMSRVSSGSAFGPQVAGVPPAASGTDVHLRDLLGGLRDLVQRFAEGNGGNAPQVVP